MFNVRFTLPNYTIRFKNWVRKTGQRNKIPYTSYTIEVREV